MALKIPYIMFTAVSKVTGLESEPLLYNRVMNDAQTLEHTITVVSVYRVDLLNTRFNYPPGARNLACRLRFDSAASKEAFQSGLYGSFSFSENSPFRTLYENRVVRFSRINLPIAAPGANHEDFLIEGNVVIPSSFVTSSLTGVTVNLASPLFTEAVKHDPNATKKAVQADVDAGKASQVNQVIADEDARTPKTFNWDLPRIPNTDHYVLYALGIDENFREADISTSTNYKIGEDENYDSIFDLANEEGRKYTVGRFPFKTPDDYPGSVGLYKQRKIFASTNRNPDTIWFSEVGNYNNFITDTGDTDPIEITVASNKIEKINHIIPFESLFFFSEGGTWIISNEGTLTPSGIGIDKISEEPSSSDIEPSVLDGNLIFGSYCRDNVEQLVYSFSENNYTQFKLSLLARHLFERPIRSQAIWTGAVHQIACVNSDGDILVAAVNKRDGIVAWGKWTRTGLAFREILTDPAGTGFYVVAMSGGDYFLEHIRLSNCLPTGSSSIITPVYQDNTANYSFSLELLPFENEGIGIRDEVSISDIFLKVANTTQLTAGIGDSTFVYPTTPVPANATAKTGTIVLPVEDEWDRDSKLVITDTSNKPVEILSVAVEGRIAKHEIESSEAFNIEYPKGKPVEEFQPAPKGLSEAFNDVYDAMPGIPRKPDTPSE